MLLGIAVGPIVALYLIIVGILGLVGHFVPGMTT